MIPEEEIILKRELKNEKELLLYINKIKEGLLQLYTNPRLEKIIYYMNETPAYRENGAAINFFDLTYFIKGSSASFSDYIEIHQDMKLLEKIDLINFFDKSPQRYKLTDIGIDCIRLHENINKNVVKPIENKVDIKAEIIEFLKDNINEDIKLSLN